MATRSKKSDLLIAATRLANHDLVSEDAPGGRAYKAFMIRAEIVALQAIAAALHGGQDLQPPPVSGADFAPGVKVTVAK